jgi:hypothetical protein
MTKKLLFVGMILALAVAAVAADAITGKWVYEQPAFGRGGGPGGGGPGGPGGAPGGGNMPPRTVTLDLKAEGAKLTGTILQPAFGRGGDAPAPTPTPIANGKVDGNNISFDVTRETPMGSMKTSYTGTVSGAEMKLKTTMENPQGGDPIVREVVAKKQ